MCQNLYKRTEPFMGTFVTVSFNGEAGLDVHAVFSRVFAEARETAALMNHYDPNSEISRLNMTGTLTHASQDTLTVIRKAIHFAAESGGAFDVSVLPLVRLWERGSNECKAPAPEDITAAAALVDYRNIRIDGDTVRLLKPGMQISLAGIAKGFVVDKAISVLQACGVTRAVVNGGGDIRMICEPGGTPWRVGVQDPLQRKGKLYVIEACNLAIASSGPYVRAYNDIIDPRTGNPIREVIGASVIAEEAAEADALATCVSVLGFEDGAAFAARQEEKEIAALLVSDNGKQSKTTNWVRYCV